MATEKAETDRVPITLALSPSVSRKAGEAGHPRHQRSRGRANPDRGRHPARHQGRAACDPRQRQDAIKRRWGGGNIGQPDLERSPLAWDINMFANEPTWTDERIELLKRRFEAGLSCRQIADDIGVSRNAVIGKLSRLNLTRETIRRCAAPGAKGRREGARPGNGQGCATGCRWRHTPSRSQQPTMSRSTTDIAAHCSN